MNTYSPGQLYMLFEDGVPLPDADLAVLQAELQRVIDFLRTVGERHLAAMFMRDMENIDRILRAREERK